MAPPVPDVPMGFTFRKNRCCPGCGTLLLIASDTPTDVELTQIKSFWMWEPRRERWEYIRDWEERTVCRHASDLRLALKSSTRSRGLSGLAPFQQAQCVVGYGKLGAATIQAN